VGIAEPLTGPADAGAKGADIGWPAVGETRHENDKPSGLLNVCQACSGLPNSLPLSLPLCGNVSLVLPFEARHRRLRIQQAPFAVSLLSCRHTPFAV
jgi:hypothetical protein